MDISINTLRALAGSRPAPGAPIARRRTWRTVVEWMAAEYGETFSDVLAAVIAERQADDELGLGNRLVPDPDGRTRTYDPDQ